MAKEEKAIKETITIKIDITSYHWFKYLAERLGKTQIQLFREILQPLYRSSKVKGDGQLNLTSLEFKALNGVVYRFTKSTNVGENDE